MEIEFPAVGRRPVILTQAAYVRHMLTRYGMSDRKPVGTPMIERFCSILEDEEDKSVVDQTLFQQYTGSLMYLAIRTRPNISAEVSILSRFAHFPTACCHHAVKRVLRYLRGTMDLGLEYKGKEQS